jgi:hypothetical protein
MQRSETEAEDKDDSDWTNDEAPMHLTFPKKMRHLPHTSLLTSRLRGVTAAPVEDCKLVRQKMKIKELNVKIAGKPLLSHMAQERSVNKYKLG